MLRRIFWSFVLLFLYSSCQSYNKPKVLRLAHGLDTNHSVHKAMVKLGEELAILSGGTIHIEVFPNQQLGSERECLELLQIGILDMAKVSSGVLENFSPSMKIFGLPYLFKDKDQMFKVLDGPIGTQIIERLEQYDLKGLAYFDAGSRSFYTKTAPLEKPEDLNGLKIRVMESITAMDMVSLLGGSPTPISWGELYTALQQDVVDGAENNPPSFFLSKQYEVCKYYTLDEHTRQPDILVGSQKLWKSLNKEEKSWFKKALKVSTEYQRKLWSESESEALSELSKKGVIIYKPNKEIFKEKIRPLYENIKKDTILFNLIQKIQQQ